MTARAHPITPRPARPPGDVVAATGLLPEQVAPVRLPLGTLAIGFGLAGLAEVWTMARPALALPRVVPEAFWALTAAAWIWLLVAHGVRGRRSGSALAEQLRHPAQGPLASLAPVTGMLIAADLTGWSATAGRILFFAALGTSAWLGAWLIASWLEGRRDLESMHAGYLLPTVAPGLIGADVARVLGYPGLAWALFGVGIVFAVVMTGLLFQRLIFQAPLPDALLPTTMITLAPPAVAGLAWFALNGQTVDAVAQSIAGLGVLMALVQAAMLSRYRKLTFSLGFWSFTFPVAAAVALTVEWLEILEPTGWRAVTGVLVVLFTAFVAAVAIGSLRLAGRR